MNTGENDADGELKRKQTGESSQKKRPKLKKDSQGNKQPSSSENGSRKQSKRDKLDYNVLVRPKSQNKHNGG